MKEIFEKISSYNIFNYLVPGSIFVIITENILSITIKQNELIENLFLYYFCGLIISRLGSLLIEPTLRKTKFIIYSDYQNFLNKSKTDPKLEVLSESNNMYRTFISLFITELIVWILNKISTHFNMSDDYYLPLFLISMILIFLFAYKKQSSYIYSRINSVKGKE